MRRLPYPERYRRAAMLVEALNGDVAVLKQACACLARLVKVTTAQMGEAVAAV